MKQRTMMFILLLGCVLFGTVREAVADACTAINSTFAMPGKLIIPQDLPVGSQIGTDIVTSAYQTYSNCTKTTTGNMNVGIGTNATYVEAIPGARLYATGIPGVSFSLAAVQVAGCTSLSRIGDNSGYQGNLNMHNVCANSGVWSTVSFQYTLRFYKTATTTGSGNVSSLAVGYSFVRFDGSGFITPDANLTVTGLTTQTTACSVTGSNISVNLDHADLKDVSRVGSTAGSKAFNIGLNNCDAGLNVSMYLSAGGAGSSNTSLGLLNADSNSTASGFGLQLLYNGTPVQLGPTGAFRVITSPTTSGASYTIPMTVRYYQTDTQVTPGKVNSSATFTMIYN